MVRVMAWAFARCSRDYAVEEGFNMLAGASRG
jgi:hypothetical protein